MCIDEEYSAYFTIEGQTNQGGVLDGCSATIFAVSDGNAKYLVWVGFVNNYLQIYSYFNGESRCGQTSNKDGVDSVHYSSATIGDLRPSRGLKYEVVLYDLAFYNKVLSEDEVKSNYNHANSKWHIE